MYKKIVKLVIKSSIGIFTLVNKAKMSSDFETDFNYEIEHRLLK